MPSNKYVILNYPKDGQEYGNFEASNPKKAGEAVLMYLGKLFNVSNVSENGYIIFTIKNVKSGRKYIYIGTLIEMYDNNSDNNSNNNLMEKRFRCVITEISKRKPLDEQIYSYIMT